MSHFIDACRGAGIKLRHQRLEIFREVARTDEHPDAETIFKRVRARLPTVSLDTVYRTLWLLVDLNLASLVRTDADRLRFDANMRPHHHFVCSRCGLVRDFDARQFDEFPIPQGCQILGQGHLGPRGIARLVHPLRKQAGARMRCFVSAG